MFRHYDRIYPNVTFLLLMPGISPEFCDETPMSALIKAITPLWMKNGIYFNAHMLTKGDELITADNMRYRSLMLKATTPIAV